MVFTFHFEQEKSYFPILIKLLFFLKLSTFSANFSNSGPRFVIFGGFSKNCDFSFKISRPQLLRHSLPRFFRAQSARGEFARAREVHERSGRLKRVLGAKRRVRFEKEITHPQGALTCTCTRSHMCVPESVHTCAHKCACRRVRTHACARIAPFGCMKSTHPKGARKT